jgi:exonuclease VII small subunit
VLDKVTKETGMQVKNYETQLQELKSAVQSLEEENMLLKDFAFEVNPTAQVKF